MDAESFDGLCRKLQRRFERLQESPRSEILSRLKSLWGFFVSEPLLKAIFEQLQTENPDDETAARQYTIPPRLFSPSRFPPKNDEPTAMAAFLLTAICVSKPGCGDIGENEWRNILENCNALNDEARGFKTRFLNPLWDYFQDKLEDLQFLIGRVLQYKQRCEWFERQRLKDVVDKTDADKIEKVLKQDLFLYLHDQGITFYIEPYSDRGEIDLVLDQKTEGRTYIEVKVFDNAGRDKKGIVAGFSQLWRYMDTYNATTGYLVVYNVSDHQLSFMGEPGVSFAAAFRRGPCTIYAVPIEIFPHTKPISQRKDQVVKISTNDLPMALD
jgi:hypothetical protein